MREIEFRCRRVDGHIDEVKQTMKAWTVRPKDEFGSTVIFAETRGKARSLAISTECCEDTDFVDIEVYRLNKADKMYNGRSEMDWGNSKDRLFLVKECGWYCEYPEYEDCNNCIAKKYCDIYKERFESEVTENE